MRNMILIFLMIFNYAAFCHEGNSGKPNTFVKDGVYWVPVAPEHSQYGTFFISGIVVKILDDQIKVEYDLPQELTGAPNHIEFEGRMGANGAMILTGPYGVADCPQSGEINRCKISYKNLNYSVSQRDMLLQSISKTSEELVSRQAVAARFQHGGEPGGFLSLRP